MRKLRRTQENNIRSNAIRLEEKDDLILIWFMDI